MYQVTKQVSLTLAVDFPAPGLPSCPLLLSDEHRAVLVAYRIAASDEAWLPPSVTDDFGGKGTPFAIAIIKSPGYAIWTPYWQEGIAAHPLAQFGLKWFSVYEVEGSPLVQKHPVLQERHLVFQFEDSTLDVVCRLEPVRI